MKQIKACVFDIDGTLIPRSRSTLSQPTLDAINQLKQLNIAIIVATGRASYFIQDDVIQRLKPDYYATINGQLVTDQHFNPIATTPLNANEINTLISLCQANGIGVATKEADHMKVYYDYDNFVPYYLHNDMSKAHILENCNHQIATYTSQNAPYGLFMIGDEKVIESFQPLLTTLQLSHAYANAIEIIDKQMGKQDGIEKVLKHLHLSWDEVIAFGDAHNDISMLDKARISVAMGNATDQVKAHAKLVTANSEQDGVALVLNQLIEQLKKR